MLNLAMWKPFPFPWWLVSFSLVIVSSLRLRESWKWFAYTHVATTKCLVEVIQKRLWSSNEDGYKLLMDIKMKRISLHLAFWVRSLIPLCVCIFLCKYCCSHKIIFYPQIIRLTWALMKLILSLELLGCNKGSWYMKNYCSFEIPRYLQIIFLFKFLKMLIWCIWLSLIWIMMNDLCSMVKFLKVDWRK